MIKGVKELFTLDKFKRDKKGLSTIIANLLLILLTLVAVGTVWIVVRNILSGGSGEVSVGQFTLDLGIQQAYVSGTDVVVVIRRNPGAGTLLGAKFLFLNEIDSVTIEERFQLSELEEKSFTFTATQIPGIGGGDEVSVAPIYESGGEKTGSISDSARISENSPGSGGIGNPATGFCGDTSVQNPNAEEPPINEQCDTNNLAGQNCIGLGFSGGTLSCTSGCTFDTSQCTEPAPPSCNGIWDQADIDGGNDCDGTPIPNGCSGSCTCGRGFTPDLAGGCALNPPVNSGVINSVWNIFFDSHDLPKDDTVFVYIGDYVNFNNSPETRCFLITYADYVENKDISYVRIEDTPVFPNINGGEGYSIWEAENCGQ